MGHKKLQMPTSIFISFPPESTISRSLYRREISFAAPTGAYNEDFTYDANGNLKTIVRNNNTGAVLDNFTMSYYANTNKLRYTNPITDNASHTGTLTSNERIYNNIAIAATANVANGANVTLRAVNNITFATDFNHNEAGNLRAYVLGADEGELNYDAIGNLVWDARQGVRIEWTPYGKVRKVTKDDGTITTFRYDGAGNRIEKKVVQGTTTITRYARDASGNVMAAYIQGNQPLIWVNPIDVSLTPSSISKTGASYAWDGGAASSNTISAGIDGWLQTVVGTSPVDLSAARIFELSSSADNGPSYSTINYALYLDSGGGLAVYENGSFKGWFGTYAMGDALRIERIGTSISYKRNGNVFYTSLTPSTTNLVADFSFSHPGGRFINITSNLTGLAELPIYGSSRLGQHTGGQPAGILRLGLRQYELSNHLGNVLAVVTDNIRMTPDSTWAYVVQTNDYYAFGSAMPGRNFSSAAYRYGFNGKEKDSNGEWGASTIYDYGFRVYDPKIGKFLSVDPLTKSYPWYTPYQFAGNKPITAIDIDGQEELIRINYRTNAGGSATKTSIILPNSKDVELEFEKLFLWLYEGIMFREEDKYSRFDNLNSFWVEGYQDYSRGSIDDKDRDFGDIIPSRGQLTIDIHRDDRTGKDFYNFSYNKELTKDALYRSALSEYNFGIAYDWTGYVQDFGNGAALVGLGITATIVGAEIGVPIMGVGNGIALVGDVGELGIDLFHGDVKEALIKGGSNVPDQIFNEAAKRTSIGKAYPAIREAVTTIIGQGADQVSKKATASQKKPSANKINESNATELKSIGN
jgi:RHS repeat-associated protein